MTLDNPAPHPENNGAISGARPDQSGPRLSVLTPAQCVVATPPPYIVKGFISAGDIACIVGAPGAGKSVLAPAMAYAVAQGRPIFDRRTKAGPVLYVAAEDAHGMKARIAALHNEYGDAQNFLLITGVSDLLSEDLAGKGSRDLRALLGLVSAFRPVLIVLDTLAAAFPGLEENTAEGMSRVVAVARKLAEWGAAVIIIHHDTKNGQQGLPRGHSLLNGALDVSLHLKKDGAIVRGVLTKNRNGPCDARLAFSIRSVAIGHDEDGDAVTAPLCVEQNATTSRDTGRQLSRAEKAALVSIREMMGESDTLDEKQWCAVARDDERISAAKKSDDRRKTISMVLDALEKKGVIERNGGKIRLPSVNRRDDRNVRGAARVVRVGSDESRVNPIPPDRQDGGAGSGRVG